MNEKDREIQDLRRKVLLPTIEAEPVRRGRWEIAGQEDPCIYYCSECHHMTDMEWPYCAECGARMEVKDEPLREV